jgi:peptide/nickel transport system substrate-binding protein
MQNVGTVDLPHSAGLTLEEHLGDLMKVTRISRATLAITAAIGLMVGVISPSVAATRSTVVLIESNALTSLNPLTPDTNLTFNTDVAYMTGMGFNYYDNKPALLTNEVFGTYSVVGARPFKVKYTVKPGRLWSDGTPITAVDLLLSHIINSGAYSKKAGLGDPSDTKVSPVFNSVNYGGIYDTHVKGLPILSGDRMSVTITYDSAIPDWAISGPSPFPVHTLIALALGEKKLASPSHNSILNVKFLKAFRTFDNTLLKKMGSIWSNDYNIQTVDSKTNPLLLVGNGAYLVKSAVANQSVTLTLNPKYNSGPATSGITTVVFKVIGDGTAAAQALANKEADVYQGQPTADSVAQLKAISGVNVIGNSGALYEHIDLRVGAGPGTKDSYTGPFADGTTDASKAKAKDLRTAFLLAYPRQEIIDKLIKPINSTAVMMNSVLLYPGQPGYDKIVAASGVSKYTAGTQAERNATALALVKKYYPDATASNPPVKITLLWGQPTNTRRASEAALVKANEALAGFDVNATGTTGWSAHLPENKYDAEFFAWVQNAVLQQGQTNLFQSDGGNMMLGYKNAAVDKLIDQLGATKLSDADVLAKYIAVEKQVVEDAITLPIFQHPGVTGVNSELVGIKPAPLSPNLVWNFWEWHF